MASKGLIRDEVLDNIEKDVEQIKLAFKVTGGSKSLNSVAEQFGKRFGEWLGSTVNYAATGGVVWAGKKALDRMSENKANNAAATQLLTCKAQVLSDPELAGNKEKAMARFYEIARLAPALSTNPVFMKKMIVKNLNSGVSAQDAQNLALINAQSMSDDLKASSFIPKIASEIRPEVMGKILADVVMIKEAASMKWSDVLKNQAKGIAGFSAITAGIASLAGLTNAIAGKIKQKNIEKQLEQSFSEASKGAHPNAQIIREYPTQARDAFKTLVHFAPHVALDPLTTRSFISQILTYGGTEGGMSVENVKTLTDIQKNVDKDKGSGKFMAGFSGVAKAQKELMGTGISAMKGMDDYLSE